MEHTKRPRRARTPAERAERAEAIRAAARRLLDRRDFDTITMAEIARSAGLAKGTVFLYFRTKEEVFLDLAEEAVAQWGAALERGLAALPELPEPEVVAPLCAALVAPVVDGGRGKLMAILDDTLEHNITFRRAKQFKLRMKALLERLGLLLEERLPRLAPGEGAALLHALFVCLIGAYKVASPSPTVRRVVAEPGMEVFRAEFGPLLRHLASCHLAGLLAHKAGGRP